MKFCRPLLFIFQHAGRNSLLKAFPSRREHFVSDGLLALSPLSRWNASTYYTYEKLASKYTFFEDLSPQFKYRLSSAHGALLRDIENLQPSLYSLRNILEEIQCLEKKQ